MEVVVDIVDVGYCVVVGGGDVVCDCLGVVIVGDWVVFYDCFVEVDDGDCWVDFVFCGNVVVG